MRSASGFWDAQILCFEGLKQTNKNLCLLFISGGNALLPILNMIEAAYVALLREDERFDKESVDCGDKDNAQFVSGLVGSALFVEQRYIAPMIDLNMDDFFAHGRWFIEANGKKFDTKKELTIVLNEYRKQRKQFILTKIKPFLREYKRKKFDKRVRRTPEEVRQKTMADIQMERLRKELNYYKRNIARLEKEIASMK